MEAGIMWQSKVGGNISIVKERLFVKDHVSWMKGLDCKKQLVFDLMVKGEPVIGSKRGVMKSKWQTRKMISAAVLWTKMSWQDYIFQGQGKKLLL